MDKQKIRTINLENGLQLQLYDISRKLIGDRWYVGLTACIDIHMDDIQMDEVQAEEIKQLLGPIIRFQQKRDRNFIEDQERETVIKDLTDTYLSVSLVYLSHPDFAKRFVQKRFREEKKKAQWRRPV